jgi:phosphohistidine phosphatase
VRTLWLLRHAKSSWGDPQLDDHERPLALRARQTLAIVLPALGPELTVSLERGLYTFGSRTILERLTQVPADVPGVLVVGHNPATEELAISLARPGETLAAVRNKYPTGALAALELDIDAWSDVSPGCGDLTAFVTPASLG